MPTGRKVGIATHNNTSIKTNKSSFPTTPYIQPLASLFPISIAVVPFYSA